MSNFAFGWVINKFGARIGRVVYVTVRSPAEAAARQGLESVLKRLLTARG